VDMTTEGTTRGLAKLTLVEHPIRNRKNAGSIPVASSKILMRGGEVVSRQAHNLKVDGSNPSRATKLETPNKEESLGHAVSGSSR
jgi:hypothetical protein